MPIRKRLSKPETPEILLAPDDPRRFQGMKVSNPPKDHVLCSPCRGYGKWWYILNFLGVKDKHRMQHCGACGGLGYHKKGECAHSWREVKKTREFGTERIERCTKCKVRRTVDSS
jgi:hypothetical protein